MGSEESGAMSELSSYWARKVVSRRAAVRGAALAGGGLVALGLAGCSSGSKKPASSGAAAPAARTVLDPTKGNRGGKIIIQQYGDPGGGLELVKIRNGGVH